jgi:hypothetical protein
LKNLTAASISSSVLRETFKVNLIDEVPEVIPICMSIAWAWLFLLVQHIWCYSVIKTGEWSEDRSKHDFASAKSWGIPFVTQKSARSGRLLLSDGQYVGSPIDRFFKVFLSIVWIAGILWV